MGKDVCPGIGETLHSFASRSALNSVALKAATVLPLVFLQKPALNFKVKDHVSCIEHR